MCVCLYVVEEEISWQMDGNVYAAAFELRSFTITSEKDWGWKNLHQSQGIKTHFQDTNNQPELFLIIIIIFVAVTLNVSRKFFLELMSRLVCSNFHLFLLNLFFVPCAQRALHTISFTHILKFIYFLDSSRTLSECTSLGSFFTFLFLLLFQIHHITLNYNALPHKSEMV